MVYRLLPEWAHQDGVMLTWPHACTDWVDDLEAAQQTYLEIATVISRFERLLVVAPDSVQASALEAHLTAAAIPPSRYRIGIAPSNDTWARDHGPLCVGSGEDRRLLDFRFNGWGEKYTHELDDAITDTLHRQGCFGTTPVESVNLVLEGGGIDTDGLGTLLVTESCLLAPTRNPELDKVALEANLRTLLGISRVIWLRVDPLEGDDTDGHVDTIARFCNTRTIAYVQCLDEGDPHHASLAGLEQQLRALAASDGTPYELVPLPWPEPKYDASGRRLPATYANFLILNGAVLVPTYRDPADTTALTALSRCFPEREVIGIDCSELIRQNGSLHCITMQLPCGTFPAVSDC